MIQAVELNFPTAQLKGYYYHFTQALWRKVQSVRLQSDYYQNNSEVASFFQKVAALASVPPAFVRVAWQGIQQDAPDDDERVDTFVDYFDQTWINGRSRCGITTTPKVLSLIIMRKVGTQSSTGLLESLTRIFLSHRTV